MANQAVALRGDYSTPIVQFPVCIMQSNKVFCPSSESSPAPLIQSWLRVWILQQAIARILSWPVDHNVRTCRGRCVTATDTSSACRAILAMEQMMALVMDVGILTTYCRMVNILSFSSQLLATPTSATASFTTRSPDSASSSPLASNLLLPSASSHAEGSGESTSGQISTSDIIAIAIGVSTGLVSFVGAYYTAIIY